MDTVLAMIHRLLAIPEYRFVAALLAATAGLMTAILAAAVLVDPYGIFGLRLVPPLVLTNRDEKLAFLKAMDPPPEAIILGSSRVFLMDPDRVERITGLRAFNASVSYARPEDYLAMTRYIVEDLAVTPRMIIIGLNAGELNHDSIDPQTITNPDLRRYLPISQKEQITTILAVLKERFSPRMVRDIFVALFYRARGFPEERVTFLPNGMQEFDRTLPPDRDKVERTIPTATRLFAGQNALSPERKRSFAEFAEFANRRGIEVRVAVLPMAPAALPELETTSYPAMHRELLNFLADQTAEHPNLRIFDASDVSAIGADPWGFNDATHPGPAMIDRITDLLLTDRTP